MIDLRCEMIDMSLIKSDFNEMAVPGNYRKEVVNNIKNSRYNNSYGCINVPVEFLDLSYEIAAGSYLFVLGEGVDNYLVD